MSSRDTVLFDLDGTLTDPSPGIPNCIRYALEKLGRPAPAVHELHWCIGPPLYDSFAKLLRSEDEILINSAIAHSRERFSSVGMYENTLYPEIPFVLNSLRAIGSRIFVATSKPKVFAERIVRHFCLDVFLDGVYGAELGGVRSDKGELIAHVIQQERLSAQRTVMVGDRSHDVVGAKKHEISCIGVTYGYGTREELMTSGAVAIATRPEEIIALVESLFRK